MSRPPTLLREELQAESRPAPMPVDEIVQAAKPKRAPRSPRRGMGWRLSIILLGAFGVWAYGPTLSWLIENWLNEPDYSHGFLAAPVCLLLLWERRDRAPATWRGAPAVGLGLIAASTALHAAAAAFFFRPLEGWSLLLWLTGVCWLVGGRALWSWCWPAAAFLVFAIPLPFRAETLLSVPLQRGAALLSCWLLQSLGEPAALEGNVLWLADLRLEVAEACSGLRLFMAFVAMGFVYAVLTRGPVWRRLVLVAAAPPVALIANSVRIAATGWLASRFGAGEWTLQHDAAGWVTLVLAALLMGPLVWLLNRLVVQVETVRLLDALRPEIPPAEQILSSRRRKLWMFNHRFALGAAGAIAVLAGGAAINHQYQANRIAAAMLETAGRAEEQGDWRRASEHLYRYSLLEHGRDVTLRRARNLERAADSVEETRQVVLLYQQAVRRSPEDVSLHRRYAELLLDTGHLAAARARAEIILALHPGDPTGLRVKALAMAGQFGAGESLTLDQVVETLKQAQQADPTHVLLATTTAEFLRRQAVSDDGLLREADAVIDHLVRRASPRGEAYLARFHYRVRYGLPEAEADLQRALAAAPENVEVLLAAAGWAVKHAHLSDAETFFRRAIRAAPEDQHGYAGWGAVAAAMGRRDEAAEAWRQGVSKADGSNAELSLQVAQGLLALGRLDDADTALQAAERALETAAHAGRPGVARQRQVWIALRASWHVAREEFESAAMLLAQGREGERAAPLTGGDLRFDVYLQLAEYHRRLGEWTTAATWINMAAALLPDAVEAPLALGQVWQAAGQWEQAADAYRRATAIESNHPQAVQGLVGALLHLAAPASAAEKSTGNAASRPRGDLLVEALPWAEQAVSLGPDDPVAHLHLGQILALLDRLQEAEAALDRAVALGEGDLRFSLARLAFYAQTDRREESLRQVRELGVSPATDPREREWVLAQAYRAIGERSEAEHRYLRALAAASENDKLQQQLCEFLATAPSSRSRDLLRRACVIAPHSRLLPRALANMQKQLAEQQPQEAPQEGQLQEEQPKGEPPPGPSISGEPPAGESP